jgi:hypothetical protein
MRVIHMAIIPLVAACFLLTGCNSLYLYNEDRHELSKKVKSDFENFASSQGTLYDDMQANLAAMRQAEQKVIDGRLEQIIRAKAGVYAGLSYAQLGQEEAKVWNAVDNLNTSFKDQLLQDLIQAKVVAEDVKTAAEAIGKARNILEERSREVDAWNTVTQQLRLGIIAAAQQLTTETQTADTKALFNQLPQNIDWREFYTQLRHGLPRPAGADLIILQAALDLAEEQRAYAQARYDILQARLTEWSRLFGKMTIIEHIRRQQLSPAMAEATHPAYFRDRSQSPDNTSSLVAFVLEQKKHHEAALAHGTLQIAHETNVRSDLAALADLLLVQSLTSCLQEQLNYTVQVFNHQESILDSAHHDRLYRIHLNESFTALESYFKAGITGEDLGHILQLGQVIALTYIGSEVK